MPKPRAGESQDDYVARCARQMFADGTTKDPKQAAAICFQAWRDRNKEFQTKANSLNGAGRSFGNSKIASGDVNATAAWSFSAEDGNALLGSNGDDWQNYSRHHLGVDASAPDQTKAHYKYPFAKGNTVYRSGLTAVRQRAGQQGDTAIFDAAGAMIAKIDNKSASDVIMRAWAPLEIESTADEQRIITGVASTPSTDRMGDIVEPMGLEFRNPLPLLWQHKSDQPVGWAVMDQPTEEGITFQARLAQVTEPGALRERIEEAWQSIKAGLVRGISIGFRGLEKSFMDSGGVRFVKSELLELSIVTVPANQQATIATIKAIDDAAAPAAPGQEHAARELPGAAGTAKQPEQRKGKAMPSTIAEQISAFDARRTAAHNRMTEMMNKRAEAGETLDDAESTEYDGLEAEIKKLDAHVERLSKLEQQNKAAAKPVVASTVAEASSSRDATLPGSSTGIIRVRPNCPPDAAFIRTCISLMAGHGDWKQAEAYAKGRTDWHSSTPEIANCWSDQFAYAMRAAVPAGVTYDPTWAGALVYAQNFTAAFADFLRPLTIIGRIPGLRRVPFNIQVPRATGGTSSGWVGESAPKPLTSMTFDTITLRWAKAAAISVLSEELVRFSNPAAEDIVRRDLAAGMVQFLDRQFVDPSVAAVANVSPGSITNGITPITPTGVNMAAFRADMKTLFNSILSVNQSTTSGVFIMTQQQAMALSIAQNSLGQVIFPTIQPDTGGALLGYPVIASENIPATGGSPAEGYPLIFLIANEILLADDGQVTVDASREASLQMDSTPDSPPTASTNMLSLWQLNMIGLRAERYITWARRRTSAVAWIQLAKYAE